jgi:hypothetical protein
VWRHSEDFGSAGGCGRSADQVSAVNNYEGWVDPRVDAAQRRCMGLRLRGTASGTKVFLLLFLQKKKILLFLKKKKQKNF